MPKIELHLLIKQIRGKLYDDFIIKLSSRGEQIIAKRPNISQVKWSKAQKAYPQRFKGAYDFSRLPFLFDDKHAMDSCHSDSSSKIKHTTWEGLRK